MNQNGKGRGKQNGNKRNSYNSGYSDFRGNNSSSEKREMHKAVCSKCGKECEVPFKPIEGKPVFCKECYAKNKKF